MPTESRALPDATYVREFAWARRLDLTRVPQRAMREARDVYVHSTASMADTTRMVVAEGAARSDTTQVRRAEPAARPKMPRYSVP
jgi:hypothetical protein